MKKIIPTIVVLALFTLIFLFCFRSCVGASDMPSEEAVSEEIAGEEIAGEEIAGEEISKEFDKEELIIYIKERIVPIIVGVLTSASALLATLATIKRSLNKIALAREEFKSESKERRDSFKKESEYLSTKAEELSKICAEIPRLQAQLKDLKEINERLALESGYIAKMISLGFSQSKQIIASGNGKKINRLLKECTLISQKSQALTKELDLLEKLDTDKAILSEEQV